MARKLGLLALVMVGCAATAPTPPAAPPPAATLVVVVQTEAGVPAPGVDVRIFAGVGQPPRAVTDARGEARFAAEAGALQLVVDAPGHPPLATFAELTVGQPQRQVVQLVSGTAVTGAVVDTAGQPVAGVAIEILPVGMILPPAITTDANGQFAATLGAGAWRIKTARAGKADLWTTLAIADRQAAATVTITVDDAAGVVVQTDCHTTGCPDASVTVALNNSSYTQYLDDHGAATFRGLPIGDAVVTVRDAADPRHPRLGEVHVQLTPGAVTPALVTVATLDASATVTGVLVESTGKRARTRDGGQLVVDAACQGFSRRIVAAADGSFTIPDLLPGPCDLTGLRLDPTDPMSGGNGGRVTTPVVAPATGVKVRVNDFFHR